MAVVAQCLTRAGGVVNKRFDRGLVVGKFYPPHAGHFTLIRAALRECDAVDVQVLASSAESIPMELRARWIREELPMARVKAALDDEPVDYASDVAWEAHLSIISSLIDERIDAVFSSDAYGEELATRLGATWVQVEPERQLLHLSGTRVRADLDAHWWALTPPVRAWFARRVVIVGAESTGTTTLANDLGSVFGASTVPEYGRTWSEVRPGGLTAPWHTAEFDLIANEQARLEDAAAATSPCSVIICDTDVLATAVWHERYMGGPSSSVRAMASSRVPAVYLLTSDDIPFVQDGLRDGENIRPWMTERFRQVLSEQPAPWHEIRGTREERVRAAIDIASRLPHRPLTDPLPQLSGETYN